MNSIAKPRLIILKIDDLVRIVGDYMLREDAPEDMRPTKIMVSPSRNNAIGIQVISDEWEGDLGEQIVDFQIKRIYGVGESV